MLGRVVNGCRGREIFERRRDGLDATLVSLVDSDLMSGACTQ
mgnify:FL=1